jgi:outer membrane lipoprotein carrier protein
MRYRTLTASFALACSVAFSPAQPPAQPPASTVAAALQKKYDTIREFTADFVQTYEGGPLRKKATERGTVQVKKPSRMRWDYTDPEKKLFISDGRTMYLYWPADKQVMENPVPPDDQATTAVLFLAGKGNLTRDFAVSYAEGGSPDRYTLKLQPKLPERDYDWLVIAVDRQSLQIRSLVAADAQGGRSTYEFTNFRENPGLPDKNFTFKIPRGADVIKGSPSR